MFGRMRIENIAIAGFQECRDSVEGILSSHGHIRCMSACHKGSLGCNICISTRIPWYEHDNEKVYVCASNVQVVDSSPRHIVCRCILKHCDIYIVSAHAPYKGCKESPSKWWKAFQCMPKRVCKHERILLLADFNCQWHTNDLVPHGTVGVRTCSPPSHFQHILSCLESSGLRAHTTYSHTYVNRSIIDCGTYVPTRGNNSIRIDYIMSTDSITCVPASGKVCDELSSSPAIKRDHRPLGEE